MRAHQPTDPHSQLRMLYRSLIEDQERFEEFKELLARYPSVAEGDEEPAEAAAIREMLNERIERWLTVPFDGLSATQVLLWRSILVEQRINVALSPWKEANYY